MCVGWVPGGVSPGSACCIQPTVGTESSPCLQITLNSKTQRRLTHARIWKNWGKGLGHLSWLIFFI